MHKFNWNIIVLSVSFFVLCAVCLYFKPLTTGVYDENIVKNFRDFSKTEIGRKLVEHHSQQFEVQAQWKVGPYCKIKPEETDKKDFLIAGYVFVSLIALFVSLVSVILLFVNGVKPTASSISKRALFAALGLIVLNGTMIRLVLASAVFGNWDMESYTIVSDIVVRGGNVYAETGRYNYTPVWFTVLGILRNIHLHFPSLSFPFLVKAFLCGIDLLTLLFLLRIANLQGISPVKTALFFYLSPISFLTTGFVGQFDGFAILLLVIGLYLYLKLANRPVLRVVCLWAFATFGMIAKHSIFYELIICLHSAVKRYWVKLLMFIASACAFLVLFVPYWGVESGKEVDTTYSDGKITNSSQGIIKNVFMYSSENWQQFDSKSFGETNLYGIISLCHFPAAEDGLTTTRREFFKYVFVIGMLVFPFLLKGDDIIRRCLLGTLFFIVFTTGIGNHYLLLPVALASLRPSKEFLFYFLASSICALGFFHGTYVPVLHLFRLNIVWIAALFWFIAEIRRDRNVNGLGSGIEEKAVNA
jgi:hypothetical protein